MLNETSQKLVQLIQNKCHPEIRNISNHDIQRKLQTANNAKIFCKFICKTIYQNVFTLMKTKTYDDKIRTKVISNRVKRHLKVCF